MTASKGYSIVNKFLLTIDSGLATINFDHNAYNSGDGLFYNGQPMLTEGLIKFLTSIGFTHAHFDKYGDLTVLRIDKINYNSIRFRKNYFSLQKYRDGIVSTISRFKKIISDIGITETNFTNLLKDGPSGTQETKPNIEIEKNDTKYSYDIVYWYNENILNLKSIYNTINNISRPIDDSERESIINALCTIFYNRFVHAPGSLYYINTINSRYTIGQDHYEQLCDIVSTLGVIYFSGLLLSLLLSGNSIKIKKGKKYENEYYFKYHCYQ